METFQTLSKNSSENPQDLIVEYVRQWGGPASDAVLDPACKIFRSPHVEGLISYKDAHGCAVAIGDPVCPPENIKKLTSDFHEFCKEQGKRIFYVAVSESFTNWAFNNICRAKIEFGEELFMDPHSDPRKNTGVNASLVRRKYKHAEKEGTSVHEYLTNDPTIERALEDVGESWLQSRRGPQIHISNIHLFTNRLGKRWLYAKQQENIVGMLVLNELQAYQGWHLNHLMIKQNAPHGTPEMLVVTALDILAKENCHYVSFGSVPASNCKIEGLSNLSTSLAKFTYNMAKWIFRLGDKKKFWEKFKIENAPSYILLSEPNISYKDLLGLLTALNVKL